MEILLRQFRFLTGFSGTTNTRSAAGRDNIVKKRSHHEFRNNFFSSHVADEWNALPDDIKSARTVNGFKCLYKRHRESTVALATRRMKGDKEPPSNKILIRALPGPQRIISQVYK